MIKQRPLLITAVVFLVVLAVGLAFINIETSRNITKHKRLATDIAVSKSYTIRQQLDRSLSSTFALASILRQEDNWEIHDFNSLAADIIGSYKGISSLQLAPNGVILQTYPLEGTEDTIGHDILKGHNMHIEALEPGRLMLTGPFDIQGSSTMVGRLPVFVSDAKTGEEEFWGFTLVLIRLDDFLSTLDLETLTEGGHDYELYQINPDTGEKQVLARSSKTELEDPVSFGFKVPNGKWTLAIMHRGGWYSKPALLFNVFLAVLVSILVSGLTYTVLSQTDVLKREVKQRTKELERRKRAEKALSREARVNVALAEVSKSLISSASLDDISHLVIEHAKRLTDSDFGYIGYVDPQKGHLVSPTNTMDNCDTYKAHDKDLVFKEFTELWELLLENQESLLTNSPIDDLRFSGNPQGHIPARRFISVPALVGDVLLGQVTLANSERDYTEQDLKLVEHLASTYAVAIQRKRTEETIERKLDFEKIISIISSRFVGISDIEDSINASLGNIGKLSGASRAYLFLFREDKTTIDNTHEWCAEGVNQQIDNLQNLNPKMFPGLITKIRKGEVIHIGDVSKMPAEAKDEIEKLTSPDIKSLLIMPLHIKGKPAGFLGFDNAIKTGRWSFEELTLLRISSEIIGSALERKQAKEALLQEKQKLDDVTGSVNCGLLLLDDQAKVAYVNRVAEEWFGSFHQINGEFCWKLFKLKDPEKECAALEVLRTGKTVRSETFIKAINGEDKFFYVVASPMKDSDGKICQITEVVVDITKNKRAEKALKKYSEELEYKITELEDANKEIMRLTNIKSQFVSQVAHDLRTPMTPIITLLPIVERHVEDPKMKRHLTIMIENAKYLNSLVVDTLTLSRLESGTVEYNFSPADIKSLIEKTIMENEPVLKENDIEIETVLPEKLPLAYVYELGVKEVLQNLISNAIKHTPRGGKLTFGVKEVLNYLQVQVKDTGIGIEKKIQEKVFDEFFKADTSRHERSAGLGLAICKRIIDKHNGRIWVESMGLDKGSSFYFTIPIFRSHFKSEAMESLPESSK